ncbi:hypothetical protein SUGI_0655130 [Cryptomeria japonica]|nr:hypothetical protein SUGI_0655130 [Cryptomeria japonica]
MAGRFSISDLWGKGNDAGITPVVVTVDNPNQSVVEVENENVENLQGDKGRRGKNARQLTWVLLLKAHRALGFLLWLAMWLWAMIGVVKNRVIYRQGGLIMEPHSKTHRGKLFVFIKTFLAFSVAAMVLEIGAYIMGWHIYRHIEFEVIQHWIYLMWVSFRSNYIAPPLQALADVCSVFFLIQSADRLILSIGCLWIKYMRINPMPKNDEDFEQGEAVYPMVLIQIPMCNEREVYAQSISAVCQLDWPKDRILIQVLDDSDEEIIQLLIKGEVHKWRQKGIDVVYRHRVLRTGYKAGNLNSAMNCDYVKDYEFVAIFDADFQPNPDFLKRTIPHFKDNPELGLVQARWAFVNKDENLLTRLQYINLSFHFEVEQQVNGTFINFFGFNGTAGVWRIKTLEESGGWLDRTMVEDMDIAVRAHLNGWKFIFLNDVQVYWNITINMT